MIGHLNKKLAEMTAKSRSKQKSNLGALERRCEIYINAATIPTSHLDVLTGNPNQSSQLLNSSGKSMSSRNRAAHDSASKPKHPALES